MCDSEWMEPSFPRTRPTEFCSLPVRHQSNLGLIELFWGPHPYISSTRGILLSTCVCVCVYVCVLTSCQILNPPLLIDISEMQCELNAGLIREVKQKLQLKLFFPSLYPPFSPSLHLPCSLLRRTWSRHSSSSAPLSSRRPCWCWTSWRSTTGTSSLLSRQSSPATRSSSIS